MPDFSITHGAPGIAVYDSETWGNVREIRLQDEPALAARPLTITATGADLTLPIWSVVKATGLAAWASGASDALGILPAPVFIPDGQSVTIDVIVAGYYDFNALNFAASFVTDANKRAAFDNRPSPINIVLGTNPYNSDGVLA